MNTPHYRAGVGVVLYRPTDYAIAVFARSDNPSLWQFPQGGLDADESPETALWRELYEETALTRDDVMELTPYPALTVYDYPPAINIDYPSTLGQVHRWWFAKLKPDVTIDLTLAPDQEFTSVAYINFSELLERNRDSFKLGIFTELADYFETTIKQTV